MKKEVYTLTDTGEYLMGEEAIQYEEQQFGNKL